MGQKALTKTHTTLCTRPGCRFRQSGSPLCMRTRRALHKHKPAHKAHRCRAGAASTRRPGQGHSAVSSTTRCARLRRWQQCKCMGGGTALRQTASIDGQQRKQMQRQPTQRLRPPVSGNSGSSKNVLQRTSNAACPLKSSSACCSRDQPTQHCGRQGATGPVVAGAAARGWQLWPQAAAPASGARCKLLLTARGRA